VIIGAYRHAIIDDAVVDVGALTLIEPTQIKFDGYGTIRVTPGGEDFANRREAADAATADLKFELNRRGVANLQDAVGLDRLSIGTREQLAVLARLAFANLLEAHGKKSPIILDDALVFSDDGRLEEMQRILDCAAERLQIIVLTCHERAYSGRGWNMKRLQDFKSVTAQD
jgi:hypothetical protein